MKQLFIRVLFFLTVSSLYSFQPQTTAELQTAVDLWVSDNSTALTTYGEINTWDVSLITDMSSLFNGKSTFNDDIGSWDVSNVNNMGSMFVMASNFNQDLSNWVLPNVTDMNNMFRSAQSFTGDGLEHWDVSNVTNMTHLFAGATNFNGNISSWDVSNVVNMSVLFAQASTFNADISSWDVSSVTNMEAMFETAIAFNADISSWDVSNVVSMVVMLKDAISFNQPIGSWDVSSVTNMDMMFYSDMGLIFNQDISSWDISNVTNMNMFGGTNALSDANKCAIHASFSTNNAWPYDWSELCYQFETRAELVIAVDLWISDNSSALATYGPINSWDVSLITDMSQLFLNKTTFNDDISAWDVSNAINMNDMFREANDFSGDISAWDVSNVTLMSGLFADASAFNTDISAWNVSNVTSMNELFEAASSFDQNISSWDVSNVTIMSGMFYYATTFNQDISSWDVSNVTQMVSMFEGASSFNQDISGWDVLNVNNMTDIFLDADGLSDENRCGIHFSFQGNDAWPYDWSELCAYTFVPDDNFEQALIDQGYDDALDDSVNTANISVVTDLDVSSKEISDLTGIEDFTALTALDCEDNLLTSLDISNNTALTWLHCFGNQLTALDVSTNTALMELRCGENALTSLDVSANTSLTLLRCQDNQLTALDLSTNPALTDLKCYDNQLTALDLSNNTVLDEVHAGGNMFSSLDLSSNTVLNKLFCSRSDSLTSLDLSNNTALTELRCFENQLTSLNLSNNTALTLLWCYNNSLTSLDVSANTALTTLKCWNNQLTSLDVSTNTALTELRCSSNSLTSLDVSANTALTTLACNINQLTSLDVSANTALTDLTCSDNPELYCIQVADVDQAQQDWADDISNWMGFSIDCDNYVPITYVPDDNFEQALIDLGYDDVIDDYVVTDSISGATSLDVGEKGISDLTGIEDFTALTALYCNHNELTTLDVSSNQALAEINARNNQISSIDVSNNPSLTHITLHNNEISSIDVSNNSLLVALGIAFNNLTSINVDNNPELEVLHFLGNDVANLDISSHSALELLNAMGNNLSSIDLSNNTALTELYIGGNDLTSLDVSNNSLLTAFTCENNNIDSLDVSNIQNSWKFDFQNNQMVYLNMRNGNTSSSYFKATGNSLTCIETLDPVSATENWTDIDEGVTFSVICGAEEQDTWHVATTGSDGSGNGTQESPFATIQMGINVAGDGNTVHVAAGTYVENINYNGKNISILGEDRETTIIDGGGVSNVVRFENDENGNAVLSGFTLTNGRAVQDYMYGRGGGICILSSPTLSDLTIIGNTALGGGGGMYIHSTSSSIITDVDIIDNITEAWRGGGIYYYGGNAILSNMNIIGNQAGNGGGIGFQNVTNLAMNNIVIAENTAGVGAGILLNGGNFEFENLTIVGNISTNGSSGGITFADNYDFVSELILSNSIVYDNSGDQQIIFEPNNDPHLITVTYSNIQGAEDAILTNDNGTVIWGDGNIDADPLFCESDSGNYHIAGNSPSSGTGEDGADIGALGVGCDDIWFPPLIAAMADTSMDEDSELILQLSAESEQGYDIYFEAESDTSSVYVYTEDDMLHINLETNWNGSSQITVMAYSDFDYELNNTTSFTLTVNPVNDEPMFHNLHRLVAAGMEFHVPIHVSDVDMDSLVVSFDESWDYPDWLSLTDNPYALTGTALQPVSVHFPLHVSDGEATVTDTFHLSAQFFNPRVTSVTDVPDDQGGRVYVSFLKSFFDHPEATNQSYTILRMDALEDSSAWVVVASGDAFGDPSYTYEVSTLMDSTAEGNSMTEFKVVAAMNEGNFHSNPAMGYSTDDIAPGVPEGLLAELVDDGIQLTWEMSADEDFQYYILEKSSDEAFTNLEMFEMIDIAYLDLDYVLNESNYYRLAAVDHAGNMSDYSDVVDFAVLAIDLDLIPEVFALHQNYPNPFNPTTQIKYDLPEDAMVSITIYDVMGRSIKSLVNTTQSAGYRSIQWNATNNLGEPVSAGMYIYMIQAGEFRQNKKMVLLK